MKNLKSLVIFIGASFMLLVGILLCVNEQEIIKLNSRLERLERYTYNKESIVFLGDSITSRYDLNKYFPNYNVYNSGIAGNMTKDILENMENRVFAYNPTKVFVLIGTNDLVYSGLDNDGIKNNIEEIINKIYEKNSNIKIYLESIYPVNNSINKEIVETRTNDNIKDLNNKIEKICNNKCTYINMYDNLTDKNGNMKRIYTVDGLHLNKIGYKVITNKLIKYLDE
jgi:lysophospholipase L1-like esterase